MKKTLLIGSALVIGFAGFSQSNANKVVNPKATQKKITHRKRVIAEGQSNSHSNLNWRPTPANKVTSGACSNIIHISDSWNPNGVGASEDAMAQNNLVYNKDLNAIAWIMRGSCDWSAVFPTSGGYEASILQSVCPNVAGTYATNVQDSIALFSDNSSNAYGGRFPGGSWLNPTGNNIYSNGNHQQAWRNAYACVMGPYNKAAAGNWLGSIYVPKPLWSKSAVNHTQPTIDSLICVDGSAPFGTGTYTNAGSTTFNAPNIDGQQVGNTVWATGNMLDWSETTANAQQIRSGYFAKGTIAGPGVVNWSIDSTSIKTNFYKGSLGYLVATTPRLAFSVDGMTGYAVYIGRSATTFGNSSDSSMTPICFKTTDGGTTWNPFLLGYDWICNHPEVAKNVGMGALIAQKTHYYSFNNGFDGVDLTVDANGVLHYVSTVHTPYHGQPGEPFSVDSIAIYGYNWDYDNVNYHPIVWDFMTDGTSWKTMMVDSLQSGLCGEVPASDTTANYSAWTSVSPDNLAVGAHLTVSRSTDGKKVFVGWGDTPPGVTGIVDDAGNPINPNTNPDIWVKGYDVNTQMWTPTTDITPGLGNCFFSYLSDYAYYDTTQTAWVTPAAYCVGRSFVFNPLGFNQYNGDGTSPATGVNYFYTNCGSFTQAAFSNTVTIYNQVAGACATGIKTITNNAFASSIENYPNPFNSTTTIAVTLTENKPVSIKVYNTIGDVVFTKTIDGNVGTNNVTFDGGQVSSGVYYYTVTAGNEQATKKMIIQK